jgi:RNA polymerase sigma-70 factor (ECF subfamily)
MCESNTEEQLLGRLKHGGQRTLAELFSRHRPSLKRLIARRLDRRLRARVDPADVLQEVYIDATRRVPRYLARPTMSFGLWLRLLTDRRLLELHREHLGAQMRDVRLETAMPRDHFADSFADRCTCPSQAALRAEKQARLVEAMGRMEERDREVLVLRHFEERSNDEVAELLGLRKAAASNRYIRALERLGKILSDMPDLCPVDAN